ncbi:MAG TPA: hypothetical protein VMP01_27195 [Pirellulaceae bacterium]|nr:hypothetical protein [Pirellulaceae bacterium]
MSLDELVTSANAGDESARKKLQETLDTSPDIWKKVGDLAQHAEDALIRRIARDDPFFIECYRRKVAELRAELGGSEVALEKMAIQRVAISWLELSLIDADNPGGATGTLPQARFVQSAKSAALRRYDAAVRSLMLIREKLGYAIGKGDRLPLTVVPFSPSSEIEEPPASASA